MLLESHMLAFIQPLIPSTVCGVWEAGSMWRVGMWEAGGEGGWGCERLG